MPEFLKLLSPDDARKVLLSAIASTIVKYESVDTAASHHRVTAADIVAPHPLPEFARSSVDGYAVRAEDTYGAGDSAPAYLRLIGEVRMGRETELRIGSGECAVIHTGGMLPEGANAVVMLEHTQAVASHYEPDPRPRSPGVPPGDRQPLSAGDAEIEVLRATAVGENVIGAGEDVGEGRVVIRRGTRIRAPEIGGLAALGIMTIPVKCQPKVGIISSGDEVVDPHQRPGPGQVRDVNAYALASLISECGGQPVHFGIVPDETMALLNAATTAARECDMVLISGGSSASVRDTTAEVIQKLGPPGVLVHGINIRPGKPTIFGFGQGKAIVGLPGNPVSALVIGYLFVVPALQHLLGLPLDQPVPSVRARLTASLPSQAGREDWWPTRLVAPLESGQEWRAEPIFGKSNLIFSLAAASGLLRIPPEANGLASGEIVEVQPI